MSSLWPENFDLFTHGTAKRMLTMLDALKTHSTHIDMLFFPHWEIEVTSTRLKEAESRIARDWGLDNFSLTICQQDKILKRQGNLWQGYLQPATSFFRQAAFAPVCGKNHLQAFEERLALRPDLIFVHRLKTMCPLMLSRKILPPIYWDMDDVEHRAFARSVDQPPVWRTKRLLKLQLPMLERGERRAVNMSHKAFVCSEIDEEYLRQRWSTEKVLAIPNAIPIPDVKPLPNNKTVLFLGILNYEPNRVAAEYVIDRIWPSVRERVPDARLIIAGRFAECVAQYTAPPLGVEFTGFVNDLDELYDAIQVVVCPILSGSGTRIKIIEAAAHGKPIVSTHIGAEGLRFENEKEIIIRNTPSDFADAVVQFLLNNELSATFGNRAHAKAKTLYDRAQIVKIIEKEIFSIG